MDLIDRQAAIDIAPKLIVTLDGYEMHNQAVANYCVEITQLPSANSSENPNSSDTISRAKAIEALKDALIAWSYMPEWRDEKILEAIAELPSVEPERIKGRWKNKGKIRAWDVCGIETFGVKRECTNCGFVHIFIEDHGHYPYCPICRADME